MNKKSSLIISIIIGIIVGALGYSIVSNVRDGSSTTQQSGSYKSSTYGISFTYPQKYVLSEKDVTTAAGTHHVISLINKADAAPMNTSSTSGESPTAITFDIYKNTNNASISDWVKNTTESNFKQSDGVVSPITIAGVPAVTYSWDGLYKGNTIVFAHNDNIIMTSMTFLTYQDDIWKDFASVIQSVKVQ